MQHTSERIRDYWLRHSGQHVIFDWERPPKDADYYRYATPLIPVSGFWYRLDKPHARWQFVMNEYAELRRCDRCGCRASSRVIKTRNDVYGWNYVTDDDWLKYRGSCELCMSCYNKIRPAVQMRDSACELAKLSRRITRLAREIKRWGQPSVNSANH